MGLDLHCPITLLELLAQFNKGIWGSDEANTSPLKSSYTELTCQNHIEIDIEELTLTLKDTNIVIKKINNRSIVHELNHILKQLGKHYIFLTMGLTEKPYEIFVSVDEDSLQEPEPFGESSEPEVSSYYKFWGVYFESKEDAMIYDLENHKYIPADLDFYMTDED
ncbi:hypothetical protein ACOCEA_08665 [Maribacter sp. CXY002]|uniref:hypothetical protein n=1 Tax=Maribacter luteocoastalis TaxID=3407671 RepID=UPI003B66C5EC